MENTEQKNQDFEQQFAITQPQMYKEWKTKKEEEAEFGGDLIQWQAPETLEEAEALARFFEEQDAIAAEQNNISTTESHNLLEGIDTSQMQQD